MHDLANFTKIERGFALARTQTFPASIEQVFGFFADPANLESITPPWLHFRIVACSTERVEAGTLLDYVLRIRGVPVRWRTCIRDWDPPHYFCDEQLRGPYRRWVHHHYFTAVSGGTQVRDVVHYEVPGGRLVERLIVRGRSNLLEPGAGAEELDRMRQLFDDLESKRDLAQLIDLAEEAEGVRVFIGSENKLFSLSGSSLVISPYTDSRRQVIGAIGVIGPTRLNYGRIVPIVDYTARLVGAMLTRKSTAAGALEEQRGD